MRASGRAMLGRAATHADRAARILARMVRGDPLRCDTLVEAVRELEMALKSLLAAEAG